MSDFNLFERAMRRVAEQRIQDAIRKGEFDHLEGHGKPIPALGRSHEQWWNNSWRQRGGRLKRDEVEQMSRAATARERVCDASGPIGPLPHGRGSSKTHHHP